MTRLQAIAAAVGSVLLALCLGLIGGYLWGGHRQEQIDEGKAAKIDEQNALALAGATDRYREAERAGRAVFDSLTAAKQKEKENADKQLEALRADVRSGTVRLSIAVDAASAAQAAAAAAAGNREARADLLPAAAGRVLDLAGEGGDILRDLNACVDKYHEAERILALTSVEQ